MSAPHYTAADFIGALQSLLPRGRAWPRGADAVQTQALSALAPTFARQAGRAGSLLVEAFPATTGELLTEWEATLGLPDECVGNDQTTGQRRAAIVSRIANAGGQSRAYFADLAAALGYVITITEFTEHTVADDVEHPLYDAAWNFAWQVNATLNTVGELSVADTVSDPLAWWGNAALECVLGRLKPAHTTVLFAYV